ncbi:MAG TPA: fumarylacetoacetate hydrolase family protein [Chloroflexia bacterium]|nr:fumarylacetoacetate hydrolase family protein [Chloroflexia bacterium]
MKLVTYSGGDKIAGIGLVTAGGRVVDLERAVAWAGAPDGGEAEVLPSTMIDLLQVGPALLKRLGHVAGQLDTAGEASLDDMALPADVVLLAPLPRPNNVRDFYAFEQHVKTARALRGAEMIPEWYQIPVFYFSNPDAIYGPEAPVPVPQETQELDYELELACVIGKAGRDIPAERAEEYIAGYMVMNDWSARDVQRLEMKMNLGPAKGKDFATSLGPWLVTPDELEDRRVGEGVETRYQLEMIARVNGKEYSRGNAASITHTFAQMIAFASRDVWLRPGDVIGSGTVGTGCILELRPETVGGWLKPGDVVEMEIERLGVLRNPVVAQPGRET